MSESDSGTDPVAPKPKISKLKLNGRPVSEEEEARILGLSEIQREELLADRANVADREKQNRALMQLLKERERMDTEEPESPDRKRRSAPADVDDTQKRRSTRQKTAVGGRKIGEASAPMEAYKRDRAQKGAQAELRKKRSDEATDKGCAKDHGHSEVDADGESESEWDGGQRTAAKHITPQSKATEEPPELVNYNYARIGRTGFGEVCFYPEFFDVINGCFVRINIGNDPKTGAPSYRMAQIRGTWVTCFIILPPFRGGCNVLMSASTYSVQGRPQVRSRDAGRHVLGQVICRGSAWKGRAFVALLRLLELELHRGACR